MVVLCTNVLAEVITIDTVTATDDELTNAIRILREEKLNRDKARIPTTEPIRRDEIVFRNVPWYSTREETEAIIGNVSSSKGPNDIYRLGATNFSSVTSGSDRVDDFGGCRVRYSSVTVAGLKPSNTYICYIYPIVDSNIIDRVH